MVKGRRKKRLNKLPERIRMMMVTMIMMIVMIKPQPISHTGHSHGRWTNLGDLQ